jgi:hypothetical protein
MKLMEWHSNQRYLKCLKRLYNKNKDCLQINFQNLTIYIKMLKDDKRDKISFIALVLKQNALFNQTLKKLNFTMLKHFQCEVLSKLIKFFKN